MQQSSTRHPAGLKELCDIVGALLGKHGLTFTDEAVQQGCEGDVMAARCALARELSTDGLKSGEEFKSADTYGALLCMLDPGMPPEQKELVMQQGLLNSEACHRGLHDANEHALFKWRAGIGKRW